MKKKYLYFFVLGILYSLSASVYANEYLPHTIPDSLKKDAYSVVRNYSMVLIQSDANNATLEVTKVITVLKKLGDSHAVFVVSEDKFHEFKKFSGKILDPNGKVIKKIKQGDLFSHSLSEDAINMDGRTYNYDPHSPVYPYTVEYTYQINYKNGIINYPVLFPYNNYYQSIEKYYYRLELPADIKLRYKSNFDIPVKSETIDNKQVYSFSLKGLKAVPHEIMPPSSKEIFPSIRFAPSDFCYDSHCGNMSNWKNYGLWVASLLKDRDVLPADVVQKLQEMTNGITDDKEKVKIIYQYLQEHSRYVSIQLGIGGFQPIDAASTHKNRYGDCKGLSNLMKAMLKAVNIPSYYCEINTREKKIFEDYSSIDQTNHIVLLVPLKNDSIWLECTNQTIPFGYIPRSIAGNNAIIIHEDGKGGQYCTLPAYTETQNKSNTYLAIDIAGDGTASGQMTVTENLHYYGSFIGTFTSKDRDRYIEYLNINANMPKVRYGDISISENKSELPSCSMTTKFEAEDFANRTGTRLFIPICPLKKGIFNIPGNDNRLYDIDIPYGYSTNDSIVYNIPESYAIESLPKDIKTETPFGILNTHTEKKDNQIVFTQNITIHQGRYDKSKYKELKDFYSQITSASKLKFVLKKTE